MSAGDAIHWIANWLEQHGFATQQDAVLEGQSGRLYELQLLMERDQEAGFLTLAAGTSPGSDGWLGEAERIRQDIAATFALVLPVDEEAHQDLGTATASVWQVDEVLLGARMGYDLLQLRLDRSLQKLDLADVCVEAAEAEQDHEDPEPDLTELADFGDLATAMAPESISESLPEAFQDAAPAPEPNGGLPQYVVRIQREEAAARTVDQLYAVTGIELAYEPCHVFQYECDLLIEGSLRYETATGYVEVKSRPRTITHLPEAPSVHAAKQEATLHAPRWDEDRAFKECRNFVFQHHTRFVQVEIPDLEEDIVMTERRRVEPRPDHVRIQFEGLIQRPYWIIQGRNGTIHLDAVTGLVLQEELKHRNPDSMQLD